MNVYATNPLSGVVKAAAMELGEPLSRVEETLSSFAVRGLRKINEGALRMNRRRITLPVDRSTNTVQLPCDFKSASFLGFITEEGLKAPIPLDPEIFGPIHGKVEDQCCNKCGQPKAVCEMLEVTTTQTNVPYPTNLPLLPVLDPVLVGNNIIIGNPVPPATVTITTTKRLLKNGDYIEETNFPVWDPQTQIMSYAKARRVVEVFDIAECGCLAKTPANAAKVCTQCVDAYNLYFAEECKPMKDLGANFFPEDGIIQFNQPVYFNEIQLEYWGDLPKKKGDFLIPQIAFEYLVAFTINTRIAMRKDYNAYDKQAAKQRVKDERRELMTNLCGLTITDIFEVVTESPVI